MKWTVVPSVLVLVVHVLLLVACKQAENTESEVRAQSAVPESPSQVPPTTSTTEAEAAADQGVADAAWDLTPWTEDQIAGRAGQLTEIQREVALGDGTERAFTGEYWDNKDEGTYVCRACGVPLFASGTKYNSGSGWPSFYQPVLAENVYEERDISHGMIRTEVMCSNCGSHLGHVFPDGPRPTGQRYCINSLSLDFEGSGEG